MNLQRIRKAVSDPEKKVISFDVFDTMILRPFWKPSDLFWFLNREADHLLKTPDVCNFSAIRTDAEAEARRLAQARGKEDITLQEIYGWLEEKGMLTPETASRLMKKEIELEKRFCSVRKSAKALVKYALAQGKTVIAISDMYLPSSVIEDILKNCGYPELHRIFVSGEAGVTKGSGRLFRYAAEALGVHPDEMIHIGDQAVSDVEVPKRLGIRSFHVPRTIDLLEGGNSFLHGRAFKAAYRQINASFSGRDAITQQGIRCMLATAANLMYDDPFRGGRRDGGYASDPELFGTFALGMYCMAHALWVGSLTEEKPYDHVLFFARDGYLIRKGYEYMRRYGTGLPESSYMYLSRTAMFPVQMTDQRALFAAGGNISFKGHSPGTLVKVLSPILKEDTGQLASKMGAAWDRPFDSETDLLLFLKELLEHYKSEEKSAETAQGFRKYFAPYAESTVLTYDIGYHMRNEMLLKSFFPQMKLTACFTHASGNLTAERGRKGQIGVRTLYPFSPYVSYLPREMFQAENGPSCEGYTPDGKPVLEKNYTGNDLLERIQHYAIRYMKAFTGTFQEEIFRMPLDYALACLPFETFLHRPGGASAGWIRGIKFHDPFSNGVKQDDGYWRDMRIDYWCAREHAGKWGRRAVRYAAMLYTDPPQFIRMVKDRVPSHIRRRMNSGRRTG